jgi:hypothetical protein
VRRAVNGVELAVGVLDHPASLGGAGGRIARGRTATGGIRLAGAGLRRAPGERGADGGEGDPERGGSGKKGAAVTGLAHDVGELERRILHGYGNPPQASNEKQMVQQVFDIGGRRAPARHTRGRRRERAV